MRSEGGDLGALQAERDGALDENKQLKVLCGVIWCHVVSYGVIWCHVVSCRTGWPGGGTGSVVATERDGSGGRCGGGWLTGDWRLAGD